MMNEFGFYNDDNCLPDCLSAYVVNRKICKKEELPKLAEKWIIKQFGEEYFMDCVSRTIQEFVKKSHIIESYIQYYPRGREDIYQDDPSSGVWAECPKSAGAVPVYFLVFENEEDSND